MDTEKNFFGHNNPQLKLAISALILSFLMFSCITQRNLEYLQDKHSTPDTLVEASCPKYQLKPNDALYIQINSLDDAASNVFAQPSATQTLDPYGAYMNSYIVDKEGFVQLPVIGKINVSGKTTAEVSNQIKDSVVNILSLPTITVRLVNQYVTILGEVRTPGHVVYSQDKFTIYNAIGLAGDITNYGNRREVILIRNENGQNSKIIIDLTRADILSSSYYFIQPNDLIYVSPLPKRIWGIEQFPFTIIFSTITTALLIYTLIQQP
jgi:polysaccharide export outer membrane protein